MSTIYTDQDFAELTDQEIEALIANGEDAMEDEFFEEAFDEDFEYDSLLEEDEIIRELSFSDSHYW